MQRDNFLDSFVEEFEKEIFNDRRKLEDICKLQNENISEKDSPNNLNEELEEKIEEKFGKKVKINDIKIFDDKISVSVFMDDLEEVKFDEFFFCYNEKLTNNKTFSLDNNPVFNVAHKENDDSASQFIIMREVLPEKGFNVINSNYIIYNGSLEEGEKILTDLGMQKNDNLIKDYFKVDRENIELTERDKDLTLEKVKEVFKNDIKLNKF